MMRKSTRFGLLVLLLLLTMLWVMKPTNITTHYGAWSLIPALLTIVICFYTRNVLLALLIGVFSGGVITGHINILTAFLIPALGTENYAQILLVYLWALGGLLGLWNRTGGAQYFARTMAQRFVHSRKSAKLFTWVMGIVFHQGGTISTVLTGTTVRPVSDQYGIAHEELSYLVDSTASPVATIIPFNVWPIYVAGLITISSLSSVIPDEAAALSLFMQAIPYNFYAWIAVGMTLMFAFDRLPLLGTPMSKAITRVNNTGKLDADNANPLVSTELSNTDVLTGYNSGLIDFLAPIGVLMALCIGPWVAGGSPMVFEGFGLAVITALLIAIIKGMPVETAFDAIVSGIKGVTIGAIILGLAVTLAEVSTQLGTSAFVVEASAGWLGSAPFILPALLLVLCMVIAFSIGSSWGTYAVVFPIALPLALAISPDPTFFLLCFGAVTGGATFGDQCSPISDTTILSALACGTDLMDHVNTQLPLALIAAGIAMIGYLMVSYMVLI